MVADLKQDLQSYQREGILKSFYSSETRERIAGKTAGGARVERGDKNEGKEVKNRSHPAPESRPEVGDRGVPEWPGRFSREIRRSSCAW